MVVRDLNKVLQGPRMWAFHPIWIISHSLNRDMYLNFGPLTFPSIAGNFLIISYNLPILLKADEIWILDIIPILYFSVWSRTLIIRGYYYSTDLLRKSIFYLYLFYIMNAFIRGLRLCPIILLDNTNKTSTWISNQDSRVDYSKHTKQ